MNGLIVVNERHSNTEETGEIVRQLLAAFPNASIGVDGAHTTYIIQMRYSGDYCEEQIIKCLEYMKAKCLFASLEYVQNTFSHIWRHRLINDEFVEQVGRIEFHDDKQEDDSNAANSIAEQK